MNAKLFSTYGLASFEQCYYPDKISHEEQQTYLRELIKYSINDVSWKDLFYSIEEYRSFYEEAIPDRYKVDSYEMFPVEDADNLAKNG